jgi:hypothetical protein
MMRLTAPKCSLLMRRCDGMMFLPKNARCMTVLSNQSAEEYKKMVCQFQISVHYFCWDHFRISHSVFLALCRRIIPVG